METSAAAGKSYLFHGVLSNDSRSPSISQILAVDKHQTFDICIVEISALLFTKQTSYLHLTKVHFFALLGRKCVVK